MLNSHLGRASVIALGLALSLGACKREATGQVAAVVGDDEITLQEINAEIGSAQIPANADKKAIQNAALDRIIQRRLMAQVARDDGLDQQPEFLIRKRQAEDLLLVQLLGQKAGKTIRVPTDAALDKYVAAHPTLFANRQILTLDQIQFAMPADSSRLKALEADHSLDAVAARLKSFGIDFRRGGSRLDTMQVPPEVLASINALPSTEPFVLPQNGVVNVAVITARTPAPVTGEQARPVALQMMRNEELGKTLEQRMKAQKAKVKVEYQSGFGPPQGAGTAAKTTSPVAKS